MLSPLKTGLSQNLVSRLSVAMKFTLSFYPLLAYPYRPPNLKRRIKYARSNAGYTPTPCRPLGVRIPANPPPPSCPVCASGRESSAPPGLLHLLHISAKMAKSAGRSCQF